MKVIPVTAFLRATLESLSLTDRLPAAAALQADPRISYSGYIPDAHYPAANDTVTKLPLIVAVHGTGRDSYRYVDVWQDFADEHRVAVIAPLFPSFLQGPLDVDAYHFLGRPPPWSGEPAESWLSHTVDVPGGPDVDIQPVDPDTYLRYDLLLLDLLTEVSTRWPGIETEKIFLMGFSGGGQFVHRFFYLHPERLEGLCVGSPGSITLLDYTQTWPTGLQNFHEIFGQHVNIEKLKGVPVTGAVGSNDVDTDGIRFRLNVPGSNFGTPEEVKQTRIQRLTTLFQNWQAAGLNATYAIVQGPVHEMEKVNPPFEEFFKGLVGQWWAKRIV